MSFLCPISQRKRFGLDVIWVHVPLTVVGRHGEVTQAFLFDTGCQVSTVSEDIAEALGLPTGGRDVNIRGATAEGRARLVEVRFRFPTTTSGVPGLEVNSTWMVTSGQPNVALLGFMEVHRSFQVKMHEFDAYFIRWPVPLGV
jgi:predicted aspartyl protease